MSRRRWIAVAVAVLIAATGGAVIAASEGSSGSTPDSAPDLTSQTTQPPDDGTEIQGGAGRGFGRGGFGGRGGGLESAATYLGVDAQTLFSELASGKTLAQIAEATSGKSEDGLVAAMVDAQQQQLDAAVEAGSLTQARAAQIGAQLKERVTAMVEGSFDGRRGGFDGPPGAGGFGPPGSDGSDGSGSTGGTGTFGGSTPPATTTPSGTTL